MNFALILDDCLERLARGESVAGCLARYPEAAEQLAPLLSAAKEVSAFSRARLTEKQRLRAKVALREEIAVQQTPHPNFLGILRWRQLRVAPLAVLLALVVFSGVAFTAVAASQPGDFVYPVRVAAERAPAWVQPDAVRRAEAELAAADRRLSDLEGDDTRHAVAVDALLRSDQAAVDRIDDLSEQERTAISAHVAAHAQVLQRLAEQDSDGDTGARLHNAAAAALAISARSKPAAVAPSPAATHAAGPTRRPATAIPARSAATIHPSPTPVLPASTSTATDAPMPAFGPPGRRVGEPASATGEAKPDPTKTPDVRPADGGKPGLRAAETKTSPTLRGNRPTSPTPGSVKPASTPRPGAPSKSQKSATPGQPTSKP